MIHRIDPIPENLQGDISRDRQPILTIDPGDTIIAGTRDCDWGWDAPPSPDVLPKSLSREERKDPEHDGGNCLLGPVAIRGAEPGMTVEVEIQSLKFRSHGISMRGGSHKERYEYLGLGDEFAWLYWSIDAAAGTATNSLGHTVKLRPFLGSIGLAPAAPGWHTNMAPYSCGGNMDCKDLIVGSKLYLPVEASGGMLSFGDGHATQSDGELGGSAIECPMEDVTIKVSLIDDMPIKWPVARTPEGWIAFGFAEKVDEAMYIATSGMLDLMVQKLGVSRIEASMLASLVVDLRITQFVNPVKGVHAFWPDGSLQ